MRRRANGQSLVEMALLLPLLLMILFGIIDLSYYVYGYATIYQAARNGSEKAAELPPYEAKLGDPTDDCTHAILDAAEKGAVTFTDILDPMRQHIRIIYPTGQRELGQPIEVSIDYDIKPLTPLFRFISFGNQGNMPVHATARRTIESLGNNPNYANGVACQP